MRHLPKNLGYVLNASAQHEELTLTWKGTCQNPRSCLFNSFVLGAPLSSFPLFFLVPLSFFFHSRNLQQWKKQKQEFDTWYDQWRETERDQKALYQSSWEAEVRFLERTLSLFPCLGQLNLSAREKVPSPALSLSSVATITSLQCLILRKAVLEELQITTICNHASSPSLNCSDSLQLVKVILCQV